MSELEETLGMETKGHIIEGKNGGTSSMRDLAAIEDEIKKHQKTSAESYLTIGRLLLEAKRHFGKHGDWLKWLRNHVDISICKAQRLMKVAIWIDENKAPVPHLDFTKAYILSRLTAGDLNEFLNSFHHVGGPCAKQVEDMSKRELEDAVRNYLRAKNRKSATAIVPQEPTVQTVVKDDFHNQIDKIKSVLSKLLDSILEKDANSDDREILANDLCDLCGNIIQQLTPEGIEDI